MSAFGFAKWVFSKREAMNNITDQTQHRSVVVTNCILTPAPKPRPFPPHPRTIRGKGLGPRLGMSEDMALPFELDMEGSQEDLLCLSEEMGRLLDPTNQLRTPPPLVDLSPLECHAIRTEEVTALTAIYGNDLQLLNDSGSCFLVCVKFLSEEIKEEDVIRIWFSLPASYPCVPPVFEIETNSSGSFNYRDADDLFDLLMKESIQRVGGMMIFDLVTVAQDYMPDLIERKRVRSEKQATEERERREILELEEAFRDNKKTGIPANMWSSPREGEEEEEEEEEGEGHFRRGHVGRSVGVYKPAQFVGSISNILKKFPEGLQIQRIENVLRQDLAGRFHHTQQAMTSALAERERRNPLMYNLKTEVAFHGTLTRSLPSIVQHGLVVPGAANKVTVRCGSSLGVGIYLSPSPHFSLSYTDSNRLLVCAALLGRIYYYGSTKSDKHHSRFNCLVSGEEWVFFNAAQVLPCYVVEVRRGEGRNSKQSHPPPLSSLTDSSHHSSSSEETAEQRKARLTARAQKFLPYGFGPGSRMAVLDVASVDEDDEDYGDYQLLRADIHNDDERAIMSQSGVAKETSELQEYRYTSTHSQTDTS